MATPSAYGKMLNPEDFVITRRRKKYRFAKFANSSICFEFEDWKKSKANVVEVGAGTGLFSVELARRYPEKQFVAVDVKADRLQKGAYEAEALGLSNVRFLRARADQIAECFTARSVEVIWLTFPDPFPKRRSAGRRLTHPTYLKIYEKLLARRGSLHLKHDSPDFFRWSLEQLVRSKWTVNELYFDLHESDAPNDYKIQTTYEKRWLGEGRQTGFVRAIRP